MKIIFVIVCFFVLYLGSKCCHGNPNLKVVLSKEGIEFIVNEILDIISKETSELKIREFRGNTRAGGGSLNYSIHNFELTEFLKPKFAINIDKEKDIINVFLSNVTVKITTGWGVDYKKGIFSWNKSGTGKAILNGTGVDVNLKLSLESDGKPLISVVSCHPRLGGILYMLDDEALFYDLVIRMARNKIRSSIEKGICDGVTNGINKDLAKLISETNFKTDVGNDGMVLDLSLTSAPVLLEDHVEVSFAARFMEDDVNVTMIDMNTATSSHMINIFISQELFNSGARVIFNKNLLQFVETTPTILSFLGPLNISTVSTGKDAHFSFGISSSSPPSIIITPDNITLKAQLLGVIALQLSQNITHNIVTMPLSIQCHLNVAINNGQLVSTIDDMVVIPMDSQSIPDHLKMNLVHSTRTIISSITNFLGQNIPCTRCVDLSDTVVHPKDGYLVLASNLKKQLN